MWPFPPTVAISLLHQASAQLALGALGACRYSLRHGGASEDLLRRLRPPLEVKRRGGWKADSSLKRYGKETRLLSEVNKIPFAVVQYGRHIADNLKECFLQPSRVPAPPSGFANSGSAERGRAKRPRGPPPGS